jgi:hypothetical protein
MMLTAALVAGAAQSSGSSARAGTTKTVVAHSPQGKVKSAIEGTTKNGNRVTGSFTPMHFAKNNGHLRVRGLFNGVIHRPDGTTKTFTVMRGMRVKSINGTAAHTTSRQSAQRATCDVLHLVLAPLDLDLLGLQVHLDKVVLDIVAKSGSGKLVGNLVCAVVHLLDGGLNGQLGRLVNKLNDILKALLMGL